MESFSAVVTTGIYCRPGCGARPLERNVRPFDSPAAAEAAGFRACLSCRPYRTPPAVSWDGPELVCRAVQLVIDGALDGHTEDELGARLGVSARHLRRLFAEHVGATPDQVARSRRAHFARRLLDDTDLSVTDVAFAAGFGSVRQLNRACHDVFRSSPSSLRARRRRTDRLAADGGLPLRLGFAGPLDWDGLLAWLAPRALPGVERVDGSVYRRTVVIDGDAGVIELAPGGDDHLVLTAHLPHWEGLIHVVQRARGIAGLDLPMDDALDALGAAAVVGPLVSARPGLRVPGAWDAFEMGVRAIVGQQVSVAGATTIVGRLAQRFGTAVAGLEQLGLSHCFPTAEVVAGADLSGLGLTTARAEAVRGFAAAVAEERVRLDHSVDLDELVASLAALRGVGPWTAHYLALRLGERDAYPATDLVLRRTLDALAPGADPAALAESWRPWRALAATHLWRAAADGQTGFGAS